MCLQQPRGVIQTATYLAADADADAAAMEVNKDEAERCVDIATAALNSHQPEKALKFLEKAQRLFPTEKAKGK